MTGLRAWLLQRLTALYMMAFVILFLAHFATHASHSYEFWRAWALRPEISLAIFVFFTSLLLHAWVGIRDVAMDYLHPLVVRLSVLAMAGFGFVALEAWVARILLAS